jgi:hypothetical protein
MWKISGIGCKNMTGNLQNTIAVNFFLMRYQPAFQRFKAFFFRFSGMLQSVI